MKPVLLTSYLHWCYKNHLKLLVSPKKVILTQQFKYLSPNTSFVSNSLEMVVAKQLNEFSSALNSLVRFQDGFHQKDCTETVPLRVSNDHLMSADASTSSLLVLPDLNAAFATG